MTARRLALASLALTGVIAIVLTAAPAAMALGPSWAPWNWPGDALGAAGGVVSGVASGAIGSAISDVAQAVMG